MTPNAPNFAIDIEELTKRFGDVLAVNSISFQVMEGELFGFLGPNGAGKTTTINLLTGLARPDGGRISIGGLDCTGNPKAAQHLMGIVPDESNLYPELTGYDNLFFCAALYGMPKSERAQRAQELLDKFDLSAAGARKFAAYSKGMKRKLTIAAGIIHNPRILFLDEPTTGIDVASARQIRQLIADLHEHGTTIFLTTHYIEEAERLCERIAFIMNGSIVRIDRLQDLLQPEQAVNTMLLTLVNEMPSLQDELVSAFPQLEIEALSPTQLQVQSAGQIHLFPLIKYIEERGVEVAEARRKRTSLEDVFVRVTGIELEAMRKEKQKSGGG
jgi:ABC-2 type transport system ATP-binding protein